MSNKPSDVVWKQFPLRIEQSLADELQEVSDTTLISKSELVRVALEKFLAEVKKSNLQKTVASLTK